MTAPSTTPGSYRSIRTDDYGDIFALLEGIHDSASALRAFGSMLGYTLSAGDSCPDISYGAEAIIRQECANLEFIMGALRDQVRHLERSKLAVRSLPEISRLSGLPPELAARAVFAATGVSLRVNGELDMSEASA